LGRLISKNGICVRLRSDTWSAGREWFPTICGSILIHKGIMKKKNTKVASVVLAEKFVKRAKGERFTRKQIGIVEGMVCGFSRLQGSEVHVLPENQYRLKFENHEMVVTGVGEVEKRLCLLKFGEELPRGIKVSEYWKTSNSKNRVPNSIGMGYEILIPVIHENEITKYRTLKNIYHESANWVIKNFKKHEPKILSEFF